ncbi:alpha/beta fold hydrolase [Paracoccus seriniphilus]|uniref:Pimeloyl-ACP methyl ester carboxylesterase n=1 Tax=Paracoccus seriniphilus TaxID=184748 RepID=A0A239Q216_9RHOB|nr:alpha/beta hydrolase [Paracoccus seriniphilus]WCR13277.1 alpha/beta hydrolase [Paracoccus seriniphilus]SNT76480.1 Pimeloyl-ACP methyl ester carboxylesterase [Paracoccus seriniphilus]
MTGIHTRHWPGDSDRPALALHCMLASGSYWGAIAKRLEQRVDLHSFDMPGHGRSDDWQPKADDPDYHTAVTRMAASFINRPLDLIGHSMGATVALRIAVAAPEAVRSLTLIEPVLFAAAADTQQEARDREMGHLIAKGEMEQATRLFLATWGAQPYDKLPAAMQRQMCDRIGLVHSAGETLSHDHANLLRPGGLEAIDAPVLFISGERSPAVVHGIADALAARLPDVGRATVPAAGHMLPITHPDEVAGLVALNLDRA